MPTPIDTRKACSDLLDTQKISLSPDQRSRVLHVMGALFDSALERCEENFTSGFVLGLIAGFLTSAGILAVFCLMYRAS